MKETLKIFRDKLNNNEFVYGPFMKTSDPMFVEAVGLAGFDYVILDMEHGPVTIENQQNNIRAAEARNTVPIIRLKDRGESTIGKALDIGAYGIQVPQINNAEEAKNVVKFAKFYPYGMRGVCRFVRAADYSNCDRYKFFESSKDVLIIRDGYLASNLGVVELTVALHRVLDTPQDKIVFDVGHQCYTHKILTGRRGQFDKLRQLDGISGFPNPNESEHDAFIAGHGNTALSLAIGMAWAKKLHHEAGLVVAVIGDGAFTGGMVYEGMNNIEQLDNLLVILNDNKMSISKNVGALARYLTHLRTTTAYFDAKDNVRSFLDGVPLVGAPLKKNITECKTLLRRAMYHSTMFEDMGFQYIGPVDGHNVEELERTLRTIRNRQGPHFLHVITKKGKGYQPAEVNPGNYHGVSAFDPDGMPDPEVAPKESFSTVFGNALVTEGDRNPNICAITAAMKYGTGLQFFAHSHPERFFDVGMAEQHAVTFAAGLASQGMLPVVCIYSTFLQRSYDQIIHDVNLLRENVVFAIDRAGFVPADGETHQGPLTLV